jgi:DNA-binding Xre family transcriptional regulator
VSGSDWAAVAKAMDRRLSELGMRQRDLAERAHVAQAIVRELQHNTKQRRRSTRTLEALSVALGWQPGHLHAVLDGREPSDPTAHVLSPADVVAGRLAAIESHLRAIEERLIDVQFRLDSDASHRQKKTREERSPTDGSS